MQLREEIDRSEAEVWWRLDGEQKIGISKEGIDQLFGYVNRSGLYIKRYITEERNPERPPPNAKRRARGAMQIMNQNREREGLYIQ
jgi:hypothetical protein